MSRRPNMQTLQMQDMIDRQKAKLEQSLHLLNLVYSQIGNHAPAERRHAVTPGVRDMIRDFIRATPLRGEVVHHADNEISDAYCGLEKPEYFTRGIGGVTCQNCLRVLNRKSTMPPGVLRHG